MESALKLDKSFYLNPLIRRASEKIVDSKMSSDCTVSNLKRLKSKFTIFVRVFCIFDFVLKKTRQNKTKEMSCDNFGFTVKKIKALATTLMFARSCHFFYDFGFEKFFNFF